MTTVDPRLEKEHAEAFADYDGQLAAGQKARAADALIGILDDPAKEKWHGEAYARLGDILAGLDLPYAAVCAWVRAFGAASDETVTDIGTRVPRSLELAEKVGDPAILEKPFGANLGLGRTDDVRGQMAYLAAKENLRRKQYGVALGILKLVREGDPLYADAKVLEGVILNQQGKPEEALKPFEAARNAGRDKERRWQDSLQLNVGRTWYGAGNFPKAIEAYAQVSRQSEFWPQSQFERAWAHFRLDDVNGALGLLFSLDTAFFAKWYFPEADLLRIYSMFLVCKFPEASGAIDAFRDRYKPVHQTLADWGRKSEQENWDAAIAYRRDGSTGALPAMILRPWAVEDRFSASASAVASADDELKRLKNAAANPFTQRAREWLQARRDAIVAAEGARIQDRVEAQEVELGEMLGSAEIFTLDILRMKEQFYQQAAAKGKLPDVADTVQRKERLRKGYVEWPFEGEIWADELGYYKVSVVPQCPASMRQTVVGK
jgi:tetratricopeptide (TPR) repeat protein